MARKAKIKGDAQHTSARRKKQRHRLSVHPGPASELLLHDPLAPSSSMRTEPASASQLSDSVVESAPAEILAPSSHVLASSLGIATKASSSQSRARSLVHPTSASDNLAPTDSGMAVDAPVDSQQQLHDEESRAKRRRLDTIHGKARMPLSAGTSSVQPVAPAESSRAAGLIVPARSSSTLASLGLDTPAKSSSKMTGHSANVADDINAINAIIEAVGNVKKKNVYSIEGKLYRCIKPKVVHCEMFIDRVKRAIPDDCSDNFGTIFWDLLNPFVNLIAMNKAVATSVSAAVCGIEAEEVETLLCNMNKELFRQIVCYYWRIEICNALLRQLCDAGSYTPIAATTCTAAILASKLVDKSGADVIDILKDVGLIDKGVKMRDRVQPLMLGPVEDMFKIRYVNRDNMVDNFHALLIQYAREWKWKVYYAPYLSMIQASMVGKSRLVQQLSLRCFVIPMVFRDADSTGYPPASPLALVKHLAPSDTVTSTVAKCRWVQYLAYMLEEVATFILGAKEKRSKDGFNIFQEWTDHFNGSISSIAADDLAKLSDGLADKALKNRLQRAVRSLSAAAKSWFSNSKTKSTPLVVFVMDEARALLKDQQLDNDKIKDGKVSGFRAYRRALRLLPSFNASYNVAYFSVVMDTISKVANFSPALTNDPSLRDSEPDGKLYQPYCDLPTIDILREGDSPSLNELQKLGQHHEGTNEMAETEVIDVTKHLFRYGRPHWGASLKLDEEPEKLLFVAGHKLLGSNPTTLSSDKLSVEAKLAVLDCRLGMNITSRAHVASELVSNHMALCENISDDRMTVKCHYPSEPILAIAAAELWNKKTTANVSFMDDLFLELVNAYNSELIATGNRGELLAKILLTLAWDQCFLEADGGLTDISNLPFGSPVRVERFLRNFIGFDPNQAAFKEEYDEWCVGGTAAQVTARRRLFLDGHVFFTHFIRADWLVTFGKFQLFYQRGAAIMCKNNHRGIDFIVPVLLTNLQMSAIIIQTKNINGADPSLPNGRFTASASESGILEEAYTLDVPYMTLYQQFGYKKSCIERLAKERKVKKCAALPGGSIEPDIASSSAVVPTKPPDCPFQAAFAIRGFGAKGYPFLTHISSKSRTLLDQFIHDTKTKPLQKYNDHCVWRNFPLCRDPEAEPGRGGLAKSSEET